MNEYFFETYRMNINFSRGLSGEQMWLVPTHSQDKERAFKKVTDNAFHGDNFPIFVTLKFWFKSL